MATWSDWFKKAKEKGVPLGKYLVINQPQDIDRLHNSGLPFYDFILIDGKDYNEKKEEIREFSKKYPKKWIRICNKNKKDERYYKLDLETYDDIISYIESLNVDIGNFNMQLFEYCDNKFGGNIVSEGDKVVIEIIAGTQGLVSSSGEPFFHGSMDALGNLTFFEKEVPEKFRITAKNVINYIKISRNEFLKGYFEFIVSDKGKIYFLDYKLGFK